MYNNDFIFVYIVKGAPFLKLFFKSILSLEHVLVLLNIPNKYPSFEDEFPRDYKN